MSKEPKEKKVQRKVGVRSLPIPLTNDAKIRVGAELAQAEIEVGDLRATFASTRKTFNGEEAELEKTIVTLAKTLEAGEEMKDVECFEEMDFEKKRVLLIRTDTLAVVAERDAEPGELQGNLLLGEDQ